MTAARELAVRIGKKVGDLSRSAALKAQAASVCLAKAGRLALLATGIRVKKEFLVLRCADGEDASGLFSELAAVIGALENYEKWHRIYAGLRVDFSNQGLYLDPAAGANWWDYYFEPVELGRSEAALARSIAPWEHDAFARQVEDEMSRTTAAALLDRHIRIRVEVRDKVDRYARDNFRGGYVLGVHFRGTDKAEETPSVPYEVVTAAMHEALRTARADNGRIFVATDEQAFIDHVRALFPGKVLCLEMARSVDGRPIHKTPGGEFRKGEAAVIDCILLSRCDYLIRTSSNLSLAATFFNPRMPEKLLERPR